MINVISIGYYNKNGKFTDVKWHSFMTRIGVICDRIRIYTTQNENEVSSRFSMYSSISEEDFPDTSSDLKGYKMISNNCLFWEAVTRSVFGVDDGISHIYFLNEEEEYKAEIEIVDYENFILADINEDEEKTVLDQFKNIEENALECSLAEQDIDDLAGGQIWKPLGKSVKTISTDLALVEW